MTEQPPPDAQPPGYPPPGYPPPPPPGYGYPPPGYGYPPPGWGPPSARTNTLAIVALVSIFVFTPAALVLGIIARNQIKQTGEGGSGMALAAIICGAVSVVFFVLVIAFVVIGVAVSSGGSASVVVPAG